jgi:DNA repair exonuclease SbcCD ATPase subunit
LCTHGGKTPIAKAVETPELEHAIADLSKIVKAPLIVPSAVSEEALKRIQALEADKKQLQGKVQSLESQLSEATTDKESLSLEADRLRARVKELESQVLTVEEKSRLQSKIQALENQVGEFEGRLAETQKIAGEFEEKFERIRQLWGDWADLIVETADILDLELIPKDVKALQEERDRYKAELETYRREDELRKELFQQTLDDANIKSWVRDAEAFLQDLKRRGQAGSAVLKACLRMDPEVTFLPEEIQTGYTQSTNATYMKMLEAKGLLWEASKKGRKAFRNRFPYWVAENIRKIRPNAPDGAIDEIADRLKRSVIGV